MFKSPSIRAAGVFLALMALPSCTPPGAMSEFDLQGHRGARGMRPENTIPAFRYALDQGVTTLELDVIISADNKVVVSHDPVFNPAICSHPDGAPVTESESAALPLHSLTYDQIAAYDCGVRRHPGFPEQVPERAHKPLLVDLAGAVKVHIAESGRGPVKWNIETKSTPAGDGHLNPDPETFAALLHGAMTEAGILSDAFVQSFDIRTLQSMRRLDPEVPLVLLIAESLDQGLEANLAALGFVPAVYSPDFRLVDEALVRGVHERGMTLIPWTVNEVDDMERLRSLGVDGLITDYPNRGRAWLDGKPSPPVSQPPEP
jgi:glycerophosphoryl diester phosphodiesterase